MNPVKRHEKNYHHQRKTPIFLTLKTGRRRSPNLPHYTDLSAAAIAIPREYAGDIMGHHDDFVEAANLAILEDRRLLFHCYPPIPL